MDDTEWPAKSGTVKQGTAYDYEGMGVNFAVSNKIREEYFTRVTFRENLSLSSLTAS